MNRGVAVILILVFASSASAQQWYAESQVGRIRSILGPSAGGVTHLETPNMMAGVRYDHPSAGLQISMGLPVGKQESVWGAVGGWKRLPIRRDVVFIGLDLAGNGFLLRDGAMNGRAMAGQVLPVVGFDKASFEVRGRAGVSHYASRFGPLGHQRTVKLADLQVTYSPESTFAITPALRGYGAEDGTYTYAGVTAIAGNRHGAVWGTVGHWLGRGAENGMPWAVGGTVRVHPRIALNASHRRDTVDPLYATPPQTAWGLGISIQIGGPPAQVLPPIPAASADGRVTIRLAISESATPPRIAGDFNNWKPQPMEQSGRHWIYTVKLDPGVYNYAFVNDEGEWFVPKNVPGRRDDGMGGHVAVLVVR